MVKVVQFFPYRQGLGRTLKEGSKSLPNGSLFAGLMAQAAGFQLDNHICFVVSQYGKEVAFYWSDGNLIECSAIVAGDCNKDHSVFTELWVKPQ